MTRINRLIKLGLGAAVFATSFVFVNLEPVSMTESFGVTEAQAQRGARREKPRTRQGKVLSKKVGERVTAIQEAIEAERFSEALTLIQRAQGMPDLAAYEKAVLFQLSGQVYLAMENFPAALQAFKNAHATNGMPDFQQNDLLFTIGQLYLAEGNTTQAIQHLEQWLRNVENPTAAAYFALARAYGAAENYDRALYYAELCISKAEEAGEMQVNWVKFASQIYFQDKQYSKAKTLSLKYLPQFPKEKTLWAVISQAYSMEGNDRQYYNVRQLMFHQGMATTSADLVNVASLHISNETPYRGAKILKKGLDDGRIDKKSVNYQLLAQGYQGAREWKASIPPLKRAAELDDKGDLFIQLGQSYLFDDQYRLAEQAFRNGIRKGKLRDAYLAWTLLGTTQFNLGKCQEAVNSYSRAVGVIGRLDKDSSKRDIKRKEDAQKWIRYIQSDAACAGST